MKLTLSQLRALKRLTVLNLQDVFDVLNLPLTYLTFEELLRHDQLFRSDLERCLNRFQRLSAEFCLECGSFEDGGEIVGSLHVCDACLNDHYFTSDYSGSLFHTDSRVTVSTSNGSQAWTEQEFDLYGWVCDDCGERFSNQVESHETDGRSPRSICPSCVDENDYRHCNDCNNITQQPIYSDGESICRSCAADYTWCAVHEDYHHFAGACDVDSDEAPKNHIHSYSTRVESRFTWGTPIAKGKYLFRVQQPLWMGIELEVESIGIRSPNDIAGMLLEDVDRIICCEDGSLTQGFEIKTPPMNLAETKIIFESILASRAVEFLRSHNGGNCGLHINLSRSGLSQLQQAKILFFFNSKQNSGFLKAICRRFSDRLTLENGHTNYSKVSGTPRLAEVTAAWRRDDPIYSLKDTAYCSQGKGKVYSKAGSVNVGRYCAVNFTDQKVEIRLPRGTLKRNTLLANLELAVAVTEFTRTGEAHAGSGRFVSEFLDWLRQRPRLNQDFPELVKFCVDRKFLPFLVLPKTRPEDLLQHKAADLVCQAVQAFTSPYEDNSATNTVALTSLAA